MRARPARATCAGPDANPVSPVDPYETSGVVVVERQKEGGPSEAGSWVGVLLVLLEASQPIWSLSADAPPPRPSTTRTPGISTL